MEHISLYRKWRPQTFGEVVGQRHVTNTLSNALSSERVVHAYLFCGPRGTGKTSTARILAKAINCVEGPTATPCNVCEACVSISEGTALDVIEIDAASNRKIDEIRDLLEKIPYTPTSLRSKVYIVDEVHQLTPEASSALLKTLEEPPGHVVFVLATTEPHKLLPTIVSRCQRFDFSLVSAQDVAKLLEHIASRESIDVDEEALEMIAEHAHGSVRDAIGVMDQISNLSGERVTKEQLADLLGEVETELVFRMVDLLAERDTPTALTLVGDMVEGGKDPRRFVESLIAHLRSLFLIQNAANPAEIVEATSDHFQRLCEQSNLLSRHEVIKLMERLGETHRDMRWSENARLVLECAIVKNTSLDADISLEGLAFRLEELERRIEVLGGEGASVGTELGVTGGSVPRPAGMVEARKTRAAVAKPPKKKKAKPALAPPGKTGKEGSPDAAKVGEEVAPPADEGVVADAEPAAEGAVTRIGGSDREKIRRAWMAVLGELKKMGQMKLYALLTKTRVQGVKDGTLEIAFPEDAIFQMDVLAGSDADLASIEETWERFVGEPVKVRLVSLAPGGRTTVKVARENLSPESGAAPETGPVVEGSAVGGSKSETGAGEEPPARRESVTQTPSAGVTAVGEQSRRPSRRKKASSKEIARKLTESFDGEIVEEEKEGKD